MSTFTSQHIAAVVILPLSLVTHHLAQEEEPLKYHFMLAGLALPILAGAITGASIDEIVTILPFTFILAIIASSLFHLMFQKRLQPDQSSEKESLNC